MEVTCRELVELVTDLLEGDLTGDRAAAARKHLEECTECLRFLSQVQTTIHVVVDAPGTPLPAADRDRLIATYRQWCAGRGAGAGPAASTSPP